VAQRRLGIHMPASTPRRIVCIVCFKALAEPGQRRCAECGVAHDQRGSLPITIRRKP
jgi:hypothetical protein